MTPLGRHALICFKFAGFFFLIAGCIFLMFDISANGFTAPKYGGNIYWERIGSFGLFFFSAFLFFLYFITKSQFKQDETKQKERSQRRKKEGASYQ